MPKKKERTTDIRRDRGQYFTKDSVWLQPQIKRFLSKHTDKGILDPYAGAGHLLDVGKSFGYNILEGMDIDRDLCQKYGWKENDGLLNIPPTGKLILTNPPYLAKNSAKRLESPSYKYFKENTYEDLYQIALDRMLASHGYVVAIIPETFLLSKKFRNRLKSITILEENPFEDTDLPVCVVCFEEKETIDVDIYKNDKFLGYLSQLEASILVPHKQIKMIFNDMLGNIGLRAVDNPGKNGQEDRIRFTLKKDLGYPVEKIINTSRAITLISIDLPEGITEEQVVNMANSILNNYRENTDDIFLCPFKGNTKKGRRRRRLDYKTARAILELALKNLVSK